MAVNKNFVVKNGLEVKSNLLVADTSLDSVGIGTSFIKEKLHVMGGIGATTLFVGGIGTVHVATGTTCLLYTSPSPRDKRQSRMPSSA